MRLAPLLLSLIPLVASSRFPCGSAFVPCPPSTVNGHRGRVKGPIEKSRELQCPPARSNTKGFRIRLWRQFYQRFWWGRSEFCGSPPGVWLCNISGGSPSGRQSHRLRCHRQSESRSGISTQCDWENGLDWHFQLVPFNRWHGDLELLWLNHIYLQETISSHGLFSSVPMKTRRRLHMERWFMRRWWDNLLSEYNSSLGRTPFNWTKSHKFDDQVLVYIVIAVWVCLLPTCQE